MLAVVVSGCRFGFDAGGSSGDARGDTAGPRDTSSDTGAADTSSDTAMLGHDEDGDGIPDANDFCPFLYDTANADGDGDGVGDLCDRAPALAQESWMFFATMTGNEPLIPAPTTSWVMNADDWHYASATNGETLAHAEAFVNVEIWVGVTFETLGGTGRQAAIIVQNGSTPYWYGEIFDNGSNTNVNITEYTGSIYVARAAMNLTTTFPLGDAILRYSVHSGGPLIMSVQTTAGTGSVSYNAPYTNGTAVYLNFGNHSGRVRWVAMIKSN